MSESAAAETVTTDSYSDCVYELAREAARGASPPALARRAIDILQRELRCGFVRAYFSSPSLSFCLDQDGDAECEAPRALLESLHSSKRPAGDCTAADGAAGEDTPTRIYCKASRAGGPAPLMHSVMTALGVELLAPLYCGDSARGLVALGSRSGGYLERDLEFVELLASQLALFCSNAMLREDVERTRELMTRNDRLSSIGAMTAGLAHEIRNPLVSLRTFTQLLPEQYDDEEFRGTFLDLTLSEIDRVCTLVGELLTFARPVSGADELSVDLVDCVERLCVLLKSQARSAGAELICKPLLPTPWVRLDEDRLKQVLMNLAMNAIQSGGDVVEFVISECENGTMARIDIVDNGRGISEEAQRRIFEPFYTTRKEGTGLGLPIAKQIVEEIGGSLQIDSRPGRGTRFSVLLPAALLRPEADGAIAIAGCAGG